MYETFEKQAFYAESRLMIDRANEIINTYRSQGYTLTVRQIYYQFVRRTWITNTLQSYKRLASLLNKGRLAGYIDWDAIEDRTRWLREVAFYDTPSTFLHSVTRNYYAEELWQDQDTYCEVWIEKDALTGVIERVCGEWRVPFFPCRGYTSQSEQYAAGKRLAEKSEQFSNVVVFHLGDHDPSGIDMSRDNEDRLSMFARRPIELRRLALNMDQVEQYALPENPTKETDSRHTGYYERFGADAASWELDALEPSVINELISEAVTSVITDMDAFEGRKIDEQRNRERLFEVADKWNLRRFDKPQEQPEYVY